MMNDKTEGKLEEAKAFAAKVGKAEQLSKQLTYLEEMAAHSGRTCSLYPDFAPYSFGFALLNRDGRLIMNGGLIYHGRHDNGGDGSAPTFSVCLTPMDGWSIHT